MKFIAWKYIKGDLHNNFFVRNIELARMGFEITPIIFIPETKQNKICIEEYINKIKDTAKEKGYPIDGCVFGYDDIAYGESLGATGHHLRSQLAFKFYDEVYETKLLDIDWTMGKTGVLTPTAIFEPVEIDGTSVKKASVHNVSILTKLDLHIGDTIEVFKANMIVPQVSRNVSADERNALGQEPDYIAIPSTCPVCGGKAELVRENDTTVLMCTNSDCSGKLLGKFTHFVSKKGMDIDGLSSATLELLISKDYLNDFKDIYALSTHAKELAQLPGMGKKSVEKLLMSIEKSREVKIENFICALGIPNIGLSASKTISKYCDGEWDKFIDLFKSYFDWTKLDDFGHVMAEELDEYLDSYYHDKIKHLAKEMKFIIPEKSNDNSLDGMKFCITGSFSQPRDELKKKLEDKGAKFVSSVSKNLDVLFCGDNAGSKLTKAQSLDIRIVGENELMKLLE